MACKKDIWQNDKRYNEDVTRDGGRELSSRVEIGPQRGQQLAVLGQGVEVVQVPATHITILQIDTDLLQSLKAATTVFKFKTL